MDVRLAPMCGVTDRVFRTLCSRQGCDLAYTEMISAMGYLCAPEQRATRELMIRGEEEPRLILQLFGKDPDVVAEAAARMDRLKIYDGFDLNMGCPAHKIAPSGEGCGLMRTPEKAFEMMRKTVQAVSVPVSVKMRLGWDREHINAAELARMAEEAGIREITVHGRTREQQYSGEADWEEISRIAAAVSIPVIGNGDIFTPEEGWRRLRTAGVAGIMIGRGAMGNPWIFRDIRRMAEGLEPVPVSPEERYAMIREHYDRMAETKPANIAVREMRKHIGWYLHGLRGAAQTRARINHCETRDEVLNLLESFFEQLKERQAEEP